MTGRVPENAEARLRELSVAGPNGVPVLGASLALAHTEQVAEYRRSPDERLRGIWATVLDPLLPYGQLVSELTHYQLTIEREVGLR